MWVEKKIRVLKDFQLKTVFGTHFLSEGEVKTIRFKNKRTFEAHLGYRNFVEAAPEEKEGKFIPIVSPDEELEPSLSGTEFVNTIEEILEETVGDPVFEESENKVIMDSLEDVGSGNEGKGERIVA